MGGRGVIPPVPHFSFGGVTMKSYLALLIAFSGIMVGNLRLAGGDYLTGSILILLAIIVLIYLAFCPHKA